MAMAIKATPVLRGKDAERFDKIIANIKPASQEKREAVRRAREIFKKAFED